MSEEQRATLFSMEKPFLERALVESRAAEIIEDIAFGAAAFAGREMPIRPGAPYTRIGSDDLSFWTFDPLTEEAAPRRSGSPPVYGALRLFSPEEWKAQGVTTLPIEAALPSTLAPPPKGSPKGDGYPEFLRALITQANNEGFKSRFAMKNYMLDWAHQEWANKAPSDRTMERWLQVLYPLDLPPRH